MTPTRIASAVLCCLAASPPALSQLAPAPESGTRPVAAAVEAMVLRVSLNTEDKGDLFVNRAPDGDFLVRAEDLRAMGFKEPLPGTATLLDGEPHVSLRSIPGVSYTFQERGLALALTVDPQLLPARTFRTREPGRARGLIPRENSGFFNYALNYAHSSAQLEPTWAFAGEAGWRHNDYLFVSDAATNQQPGGKRKLVRLMSSVTHDDRKNLQRWVAGDFFTQARELSNGANLGGLSISKVYGLNPYLIQFPTQSVSGRAALPSDLEVYMDGQRIRSERIRPGEFEVNDILAYGGARSVQLVVRDPFGRVQTVDYSFYFSDRSLQRGLHEYSYNVGAFRRGFGNDSNRYGPAAYSMFHRYGLSNSLTAGIRAEGSRDLFNGGFSATAILGPYGVLNLATAGSTVGGRRGGAGSAGYNYHSRSWNLGVTLRRDWGEYAVLGDPPLVTNRKYEGNVVLGYHLPGRSGALSLSHSAIGVYGGRTTSQATPAQPFNIAALEKRRVTSLSYSASLISGRASLTASLSHIKDTTSRNEVFVGLIFFLEEDYSVTANFRREADRHNEFVQFTKNQPVGEGLGYFVAADRNSEASGSSMQVRSAVQYNAPAAILRGEYSIYSNQDGQRRNDRRLSLAGGAAYVGGEFALGRPVVDSFGIVKVGKLPDVRVFVAAQEMGKTNDQGKLFVPTLSAYHDNDISIAPESLPIEYQIAATSKKISPSLRSGVLVDFAATKVQGFTGTLKFQNGGAAKVVAYHEVTLDADGKQVAFQTGKAGEFYLENLKPGTYAARAAIEGQPCTFNITIPHSSETFVELPELFCRPRP